MSHFKKLSSIIWEIAEPNTASILKYLPEFEDTPELVSKLRVLYVYPKFEEGKEDGCDYIKETLIVFRAEVIGSGETVSVHYIFPPDTENHGVGIKHFTMGNPVKINKIESPLTDPIIVGEIPELDLFRVETESRTPPIEELSICCGLQNGMSIRMREETPVLVYRDLETISKVSLYPVEILNIWVNESDIMDTETGKIDTDDIANQIIDIFSESCATLEIAFHKDDVKSAIWYNMNDKAD